MESVLRLEQRVRAEAGDLEDDGVLHAVPADAHAPAIRPADVHVRQFLHETPAGLGVLRVARVDGDGRIARLAGVEARERSREHVEAPGEKLHQLAGVRLPSGGQSRAETLRRRRGRAQAIEVLDQAEHGVPFVRLPERGVACFLQGILLRRVPGPDALRERRELGTQVGGLGFRSLRFERDARHGQIRGRGRWRGCRRLLFARPDRRTRRQGLFLLAP